MPAAWTYERALEALEGALKFGIHPSLDTICALCEALGRPQDHFEAVQVTGTNGKTSTARVCATALRSHGDSVGLFTSPHLLSYTERVELGGSPVSEQAFAWAIQRAHEAADGLGIRQVTEFELLTASALLLFREREARFAVLEVGMGGRWDATSVVAPKVSVVTGVGLDHTTVLGDTVEQIAFDKAHVIKRGSHALLGPGLGALAEIFEERAEREDVPLLGLCEGGCGPGCFSVAQYPASLGEELVLGVRGQRSDYGDLRLRAPGYQAANVALGVLAAEAAVRAPLHGDALREGLASLTFPGRFEAVRTDPPLVLDGAHNPQAAALLAQAVGAQFAEKPLAVIAVLRDKDAEGVVRALAPAVSGFFVTRNGSFRSMTPEELAGVVVDVTGGKPRVFEDLRSALAEAAGAGDGGVLVTGSLYTVGDAKALLRSA